LVRPICYRGKGKTKRERNFFKKEMWERGKSGSEGGPTSKSFLTKGVYEEIRSGRKRGGLEKRE